MLRCIAVLAATVWLWAGPAAAQIEAQTPDWTGKDVSLMIGYSAGGGYDTFGRLVARHLGKQLPGTPVVIAQNAPGAGSLKLAKTLYANPDTTGTTIGLFNPSMAVQSVLDGKVADFDGRKFAWLGSLSSETTLCHTAKGTPITSMDAFLDTEFVLGSTAKGSATYIFAALVKNLFNAKFKVVTGYPGGNDIALAMKRGEVTGRCGESWSSIKGDKAEVESVNLIGQLAFQSAPDLKAVPLFTSRITDPTQIAATRFLLAPLTFSYPFALPPGTPPETVRALQEAFTRMTADAEFRADAVRFGLDLAPTPGPAVSAAVRALYETDPAVVETAAKLIQ